MRMLVLWLLVAAAASCAAREALRAAPSASAPMRVSVREPKAKAPVQSIWPGRDPYLRDIRPAR